MSFFLVRRGFPARTERFASAEIRATGAVGCPSFPKPCLRIPQVAVLDTGQIGIDKPRRGMRRPRGRVETRVPRLRWRSEKGRCPRRLAGAGITGIAGYGDRNRQFPVHRQMRSLTIRLAIRSRCRSKPLRSDPNCFPSRRITRPSRSIRAWVSPFFLS